MEYTYITTVVEHGNSYALIIPKPLMEQLKIERGDRMVFGLFAEGQFSARRLTDKELRNFKPREIKI